MTCFLNIDDNFCETVLNYYAMQWLKYIFKKVTLKVLELDRMIYF